MAITEVATIAHEREFSFRDHASARGYEIYRSFDDYCELLPSVGGKGLEKILFDYEQRPFDLLDVGCGKGLFLSEVANMVPNSRTAGVSAYDYRQGSDHGKKVDYRVGDAQRLNRIFPDRKFDVITSVHCFYYLADQLNTLRHTYHLLKPDGVALIHGLEMSLGKDEIERATEFWQKNGVYAELTSHAGSTNISLKKSSNIKLPMPFEHYYMYGAAGTRSLRKDSA